MSTGINIASSSGITVGTTAVTSGTNGRVFFQAGGVIQQDANFTYDNTLKRLFLKASGSTASDIPFVVQNSAGTLNNLTVNGLGLITSNVAAPASYVWTNHLNSVRYESGSPITNVTIKTNYPFVESFYIGRNTGTANSDASTSAGLVYSHQGEFTVRNTQTGGYYGITLNAEQNLEQRVGIDTGRTAFGLGWSLRNFTNSVDYINFSPTTARVGIGWNSKGAVLGAILDVKAQGALSTDIAFRVRNSADSANLLSQQGDGLLLVGSGVADSDDVLIRAKQSTTNYFKLSNQGGLAIGNGSSISGPGTNNTAIAIGYLSSALTYFGSGGGVAIGQSTFADSNCVGIGTLSKAGGGGPNFAVSIGYNATTNSQGGEGGIAIGYNASCGTSNSNLIAIGRNVTNGSYGGLRNQFIGQYITGSLFQTDMIVLGGGTGTGASAAQPTISESFSLYMGNTQRSFFVNKNTNVVLRSLQALTSGTHFETAATNTFTIHNGTAPVANIADATAFYSADITAGNAAPHFRTENGAIVKVYQETTGVGASTLVTGLGTPLTDTDTFDGYTLKQIVKALRNQGLLA
jgi:hypothetical protein